MDEVDRGRDLFDNCVAIKGLNADANLLSLVTCLVMLAPFIHKQGEMIQV